MEILLAIVVASAVIFFGALISIGNERQRRAIDALHKAYRQWAVQDLRLKRGTVSAQFHIEDIADWLTTATSLAFGRVTNLRNCQFHNVPVASVEFQDMELGKTIICALESPDMLIPLMRKRRSVFRNELRSNPIFYIGKKTTAVELSMFNAGIMFDIELPIAWSLLTGQATQASTLWIYILD